MKNVPLIFGLVICCLSVHAQTVEEKLSKAVQQFEKDSQMRHAILGLAVMDAKTGNTVFEKNSQVGLAPASTQKIITSTAAFELLGNDFTYKTQVWYNGKIENGRLRSNIYVAGAGDPTFGSWRYAGTKDSVILKKWIGALRKKGIRQIEGDVVLSGKFPAQNIPDGWIWQDIGNYYGAGAYGLNWKENQYDLVLKSGDKVGDNVTVVSSGSKVLKNGYTNELKTAAKGTGDNAYIYFEPAAYGRTLVGGTIPAGEKSFTISGATSDPSEELRRDVIAALSAGSIYFVKGKNAPDKALLGDRDYTVLDTHISPPLDSIAYWFMRRSINLYGEALVKTMAHEKTGYGSTDTGIRVIRDFWSSKGLDKAAIGIIDGSGLSPQNRITTDALVQILKYAQARPWYKSFYESLPTFNGMRLKSGSIGGARAFAGYHTSAQGKEYIVAIIVNNYAGSSGEIVKKMYKVLDELK